MKARVTLLLLVCLAFGMPGIPGEAIVARGCCADCHAPKSPRGTRHDPCEACPGCSICCPAAGFASLTTPDIFWMRPEAGGNMSEPDWFAGRRNYPPPLPPPRDQGC